MLYRTNCALSIRGDLVDKGAEIDLTKEQVAELDPADIEAVSGVPEEVDEPEVVLADIPLEDMSYDQLQARAKELELSTRGSKEDIRERIKLHLASPPKENDSDNDTKHIVTQEDLDRVPALAARGVKVGDEIDPSELEDHNDNTNAQDIR